MGEWSEAGKGAAGGAATGAAAGAALGPYGALIGGAAGGVLGGVRGYLNGRDAKRPAPLAGYEGGKWLSEAYMSGAQRSHDAPLTQNTRLGQIALGQAALGQAARLDPSQQAQVRAMQMDQAQRLGAIAAGQQQGAGEMAVGRQLAQAAAQQAAMARMNRGMSGASAARGAARNLSQLGVTGAGQAQMAALQDQAAANQQLGGLYDSMRGADIGLAGQNAQFAQQRMLQQGELDQQRMLQQGALDQQTMLQQGAMDQQTALANADRQLAAMGMDEQTRLAYLAQLADMDRSVMNARIAEKNGKAPEPSLWGPLLQAGGGILAAYASRGSGQGGGGSSGGGYTPYGNNTIDPFKGY